MTTTTTNQQPRYIVGGRQRLGDAWQTSVLDTTTGEVVSWHINWSSAAAQVRRLRKQESEGAR